MADLPPYTCDPNVDVFDRLDIYDSEGNFITGFVANICTAQWFCEAYEVLEMYGPNYPLEWRYYTPPGPAEPESDPE